MRPLAVIRHALEETEDRVAVVCGRVGELALHTCWH